MIIRDYIKEYTSGDRVTIRHVWSEVCEYFAEVVKHNRVAMAEEFEDVFHFVQLWLYWRFGLNGELWHFTRHSVQKFMDRKKVWNQIYVYCGLPENISGFVGNYNKIEKVVRHLARFGIGREKAEEAYGKIILEKPLTLGIFTEGTLLMHRGARGHSREEIVRQVADREPSVSDFASYVPIGMAVEKVQNWAHQGAKIVYITSRTNQKEISDIQNVLRQFGFPEGVLEYRKEREEYKDVIKRIKLDTLIEDDCESIGGEKEMVYTQISPELKEKIRSISVKEFGGIDCLPDVF